MKRRTGWAPLATLAVLAGVCRLLPLAPAGSRASIADAAPTGGGQLVAHLGDLTARVLLTGELQASILLPAGVPMAVGLSSAIYPAVRAANLDPIESLRYE